MSAKCANPKCCSSDGVTCARPGCDWSHRLYSTAGPCSSCGRYAEKRYGGEGRYLLMCADCWIAS